MNCKHRMAHQVAGKGSDVVSDVTFALEVAAEEISGIFTASVVDI